jgi:hypothetical protein
VRTLRITLGLLVAAFPVVAQRRAGPAAPAANAYGWQLAIGTSAGFIDVHAVGSSNDITGLTFPGWGSGLVAAGAIVPTIPSLYMTIPMGDRIALEPSLDLHRVQRNGPSTVFGSQLGARVDYAFDHAFYGAAGVDFFALKATGRPMLALSGVGLAAGYRFHLAGAWGGRVEASHTIWAKDRTAGQGPLSVTALSFGAMVAVR